MTRQQQRKGYAIVYWLREFRVPLDFFFGKGVGKLEFFGGENEGERGYDGIDMGVDDMDGMI